MAIGGKTGECFSEINVTPLTDVFLVLLVIMILVAPLVNQTVLKVSPPAAGPASTTLQSPEKKIAVHVYSSGKISINGTEISSTDSISIQKKFESIAQNVDLPIELQSDADAQQKNVVAVMDAAAGAGMKQLRVLPLSNNN